MDKIYKSLLNVGEFNKTITCKLEYLKACEEEFNSIASYLNLPKKIIKPLKETEIENKLPHKENAINTSVSVSVDGYFQNIMNIETEEELELILPTTIADFKTVISLIILNLNKEINDYYLMFYEESDKEFKISVQEQIEHLEKVKNMLQAYYQKSLTGGFNYVRTIQKN